MKKERGLIVFLSVLFLPILLYTHPVRGELIDIQFDQTRVSAKLNRAPVDIVFERFGRKYGLWFRGLENLFNPQVSVEFKDLSLEEAIKRVLRAANYSVVFDEADTLIGVIIICPNKSGCSTSKGRHIAFRDMIPFEEVDETTDYEEQSHGHTSDYPFDAETTTIEDSIGITEIVDNDVGLDLSLEDEVIMATQDSDERNSLLEGLIERYR
jgi:hypothetical protein